MKFNPNAFEILQERGFVQITSHEEELKKALKKGPITFYLGIDPSADNLHIGNFFALTAFKILQDCGHKGLLLLGGATGEIGDPSFKNDMRKLMTTAQIDKNVASIKNVLKRFLDIDKTTFVNNADWTRPRGYVDFMREVGTHFNVAKMLANECYKVRLEEGGLTFFEMGYMLIQSYDFVHLNNKYGCTLQIGGSDQWGNILAGVELGRKMSLADGKRAQEQNDEARGPHSGGERPQMFALACPLLTNSEGQKMGKTEKGTLWISKDKTSVYDFYQYFVNVDDRDVERLLKAFTMLPINEISSMCKKDIVAAKKLMAFEVTKKIHGEADAAEAQRTAQQLFSGANTDNAPSETISIARGANIVDFLALTSIIKSKREARELIEAGAIQLDNEKITDINYKLDPKKKEFLVKKGKKTFLKIVLK